MGWPKGKKRVGPSPLKGRKRSPEAIRKAMESAKRNREEWLRTATPDEIETKRKARFEKQSATIKRLYADGKIIPPQLGKPIPDHQREAIRESNRRRVFTPEIRENMSEAQRGRSLSDDQRQKHTERMRTRVAAGEWKNPIFLPHDEEARRKKMSEASRGKPKGEEHRRKLAESNRKRAQDAELEKARIAASVQGLAQHPNKLERRVLDTLTGAFPDNGWRFNDGVLVGRKVPDFVRSDGLPIMVDVHGDFWHRGEDPAPRIDHFAEHGFALVVVWEHEFNDDPNILIERVRLAEQEYSQKEAKEA